MKPQERARMARQRAIAAEAAYAGVVAVCGAVEAHIKAHGRDGLADMCRLYAGHDMRTKTAILMTVKRLAGAEAQAEVREVLPWL